MHAPDDGRKGETVLVALKRRVAFGWDSARTSEHRWLSRSSRSERRLFYLNIVLPVERGNLDPMLLNNAVKNNYVFAVFNALFSFDKNGDLQPGLALGEQVSADGLTHTLTLRQDVAFHDGSPLTADDVVFSLSPLQKQSARSVNKSYLALVDFSYRGRPVQGRCAPQQAAGWTLRKRWPTLGELSF